MKKYIKFENYKKCLEATKTKQILQKKNDVKIDTIEKDHKGFIKTIN